MDDDDEGLMVEGKDDGIDSMASGATMPLITEGDDDHSEVSGVMRAPVNDGASEVSGMMKINRDDDASSASGVMRVGADAGGASEASGLMNLAANNDDESDASAMFQKKVTYGDESEASGMIKVANFDDGASDATGQMLDDGAHVIHNSIPTDMLKEIEEATEKEVESKRSLTDGFMTAKQAARKNNSLSVRNIGNKPDLSMGLGGAARSSSGSSDEM